MITPIQFDKVVDLLGEPRAVTLGYILPPLSGQSKTYNLGDVVTNLQHAFGTGIKVGRHLTLALEDPRCPMRLEEGLSGVSPEALKRFYRESFPSDQRVDGVYVDKSGNLHPKTFLEASTREPLVTLNGVEWVFGVGGTYSLDGTLVVHADYDKVKVQKRGKKKVEKEGHLINLLRRENIPSVFEQEIVSP